MGRVLIVTLAMAVVSAVSSLQLGIHEGKIVSAADGVLSIVDEDDGDNEEFVVSAETTITLKRKAAEVWTTWRRGNS